MLFRSSRPAHRPHLQVLLPGLVRNALVSVLVVSIPSDCAAALGVGGVGGDVITVAEADEKLPEEAKPLRQTTTKRGERC